MNENEIERRCKKLAEQSGYTCKKIKFIQSNGCPDRMFYKPGRLFFVEFKTTSGKTSAIQDYQISKLREATEVYVVNSVEDFKLILTKEV